MLLLSLAVHGAVLMIPVSSSEEAAIPPPDPEQDNIAITRIPPTEPQSKPTPTQTLTASTPLARPAQASPAQRATQPTAAASATNSRSRQAPTRRTTQPNRSQSSRATSQGTVPNLASSPTASPPAPPPASLPLSNVERPPFNATIHQRLLAHAQTLRQPQSQLNQLTASLVQQYAYSAENTSGEAFGNNLAAWVNEIKNTTGKPDLWNEALDPALTLKHYRRVCLEPSPQKAVVGALVSPSGAIQGMPTLLQSTGYPFLNTAVLETVGAHAFPVSGEQKAYTVDVNIQVDYGSADCLKPYTLSQTASR